MTDIFDDLFIGLHSRKMNYLPFKMWNATACNLIFQLPPWTKLQPTATPTVPGINSNFMELRPELNLFLKIWNWNYLIPLKNGFNSNSGNSHKNFAFTENLSTVDTSLNMLSYFPIIKSLYWKYNTMLPSSAKFQSLPLAVGQLCKLSYLSTVCSLYLTGIGIGIGINSHQDFGIRIGIKSKNCCQNWNWN